MNIILIGHKSSGKTTIGKALAENLKTDFVDTDELMLQQKPAGSMADLFKTIGKTDFRELETKTIAKLKEGNAVISTGGGALLNPDNCEHLKQIGKLIYLKNDFDTLQSRNSQREQHGILANTANLKQNYLQRDSLYKQHADLTISCDNKTIKEIIQLITTGKQHG